ncbi:F0F1 ATP synthase subunit delta [Desulfogranum japonicum]|uniref:F0F1 ATP synthase subunit delta n=1 Tax=Desulfogranum japonicum TaxID=231447 RepID=UPI00040C2312|nr:F0F1 ATP synthase subunit delta [Desulfogranum japonicum]
MNWSTFLLESINFLVLVWILKRFFYKPVREVIERRQATIDKSLADAKKLASEGETLKGRYENRLADWEKEKQLAHEAFTQEIEEEYSHKLEEMKQMLAEERMKSLVSEERRQADMVRNIEETALQQAASFAALLLKIGACQDMEKRLVEMVIQELSLLSAERIANLRIDYSGISEQESIVTSAFELPENLCRELGSALEKLVAVDMPLRFEQDSELLAGVQITIGSWVLGANLRDELKGFVALSHAEG